MVNRANKKVSKKHEEHYEKPLVVARTFSVKKLRKVSNLINKPQLKRRGCLIVSVKFDRMEKVNLCVFFVCMTIQRKNSWHENLVIKKAAIMDMMPALPNNIFSRVRNLFNLHHY